LTDSDVSAEAERLRAEAAALPSPDQVRELALRAVAHGGTPDMSVDEIREIGEQAVDSAEQVAALLSRLSGLMTSAPPSGDGDW
jgi:hypothetical protein